MDERVGVRTSEKKSNLKVIEIMCVVLLFALNLFDHRSEVGKLIDPSVLRWQILLYIPFRRAETLQTSIPERQTEISKRAKARPTSEIEHELEDPSVCQPHQETVHRP